VSGVGRVDSQPLISDLWHVPAESEQPSREPPLRRISTWFLGPAVLSAVWWTVSSSHFADPEFRAAFLAYAIVAPGLIGLLWWHRRPLSKVGPLLTAFGFCAWPLCLQGSELPLLFTVGVVAEAPYAFFTLFICLAFPARRLGSRFHAGVMTAWAGLLVVGWGPYVAMLPTVEGGGPLSTCAPDCPANPFAVIAPAPEVLALIGQLGTVATITFAALLMGHQVVRFALATRAWRRVNWPVVASIAAFLVAFTGYHLQRGLAPLALASVSFTATMYMAAFVVLPLGFLVALVRSELFSAHAARRLATGLGFVGNGRQLQASLAGALGDPGLRLGTWDPVTARYLGEDGAELRPTDLRPNQVWVPVTRNGTMVAALAADDALATESRMLASAADAAFVAIGDQRLADDTLALRSTFVSTTDDERQRIARDMHDSAQQRLVALRVQVGLASEKLGAQPAEQQMLDRLGGELDYAIEDVRNVARRFLTPFIVRNGLGSALRSITRTWPLTVRVDDRGLSRHDPATELTVYNVCLEALQNTLDHGGHGASAHVRIKDAADGIWFSIADDGVGFDLKAVQPANGLMGMRDRALLAGGTIHVDAAPSRGVTVSGRIPDPR
jgi:signal transduction histidine kinase